MIKSLQRLHILLFFLHLCSLICVDSLDLSKLSHLFLVSSNLGFRANLFFPLDLSWLQHCEVVFIKGFHSICLCDVFQ
jgi:hypothetical protein